MANLSIADLKKHAVKVVVPDYSYIDGKYLRKFRMSLKMSQALFAEYLGVTKKAIEKWEQGKNKVNGSIQRLIYLFEKKPEILSELREVKVDEEKMVFKSVKSFEFSEVENDEAISKTNDIDAKSFEIPGNWKIGSKPFSGGVLNATCI